MILPFLNGLIGFSRAPVTWILFAVNCGVFMYLAPFQVKTSEALERYYDRPKLIQAQGEVFSEFISQNSESYSPLFVRLSEMALSGHAEQIELLGRLALRDQSFLTLGPSMSFEGDEVLFRFWKDEFENIQTVLQSDPVNRWGVGHRSPSLVNWVSYQFLHGGFLHLLSNMWFLLIFGCFLEPILGSLLFLFLYLGSGFIAAGAFIELSGLTGVPLVGASGSVSGLMGLYVALFWKEKARFLYWLLPVRGYTGFVFLPAWVFLIFWTLSDLAGYFGTLREIGGIAHAAHLGGSVLGLILGSVLRFWSKTPSHGVLSHDPRL